jgi:hypothetical protein
VRIVRDMLARLLYTIHRRQLPYRRAGTPALWIALAACMQHACGVERSNEAEQADANKLRLFEWNEVASYAMERLE